MIETLVLLVVVAIITYPFLKQKKPKDNKMPFSLRKKN